MSKPNYDTMRWFKELWQTSPHQNVEGELAWLKKYRRSQFEKFLLKGFPTISEENWKYTNLREITGQNFSVTLPTKFDPSVAQIQKLYLAVPHHRLVFLNGYYRQDLSKFLELPRGAIITNIASAWKRFPDKVQFFLDKQNESSLRCLNTAFMTDGVFIYLPSNTRIDFPIHAIYLHTGTGSENSTNRASMINLRNMILCEDNSQLSFFEDYQSCDYTTYFTNSHTQMDVDQNSHVHYVKLQNENRKAFHIANTTVVQQQASCVNSHSYSIGSQLARDDVQYELQGMHADCILNGLYITNNNQHIDHHTRVDHLFKNTKSQSLYKGIVSEKSHAVFNGKIIVHKNASQTTANLRNQNLLLSTQSQVDTKPELEIYTDDVQCSHSATIGQLDTEMLFYLRARGIPENLACKMLTLGFAKQILESIPSECIAEKITSYLKSHFCIQLDEEILG